MKNIINGFVTAFWWLVIIWTVYIVDTILPIDLRGFGIIPRNIHGLIGIAFAPFLHTNLSHIVANSIALFILLGITYSYNRKLAIGAIIMIIIVGGLGVWVFGANSIHIGASGLIFGLIGYLLFIGIYRHDAKAILISIIVAIFYGITLLMLLQVQQGISWSGHFFGFIGGIYAARTFRK